MDQWNSVVDSLRVSQAIKSLLRKTARFFPPHSSRHNVGATSRLLTHCYSGHGNCFEAVDYLGQWYEAKATDINVHSIRVHYARWSAKYDEDIPSADLEDRLRCPQTYSRTLKTAVVKVTVNASSAYGRAGRGGGAVDASLAAAGSRACAKCGKEWEACCCFTLWCGFQINQFKTVQWDDQTRTTYDGSEGGFYTEDWLEEDKKSAQELLEGNEEYFKQQPYYLWLKAICEKGRRVHKKHPLWWLCLPHNLNRPLPPAPFTAHHAASAEPASSSPASSPRQSLSSSGKKVVSLSGSLRRGRVATKFDTPKAARLHHDGDDDRGEFDDEDGNDDDEEGEEEDSGWVGISVAGTGKARQQQPPKRTPVPTASSSFSKQGRASVGGRSSNNFGIRSNAGIDRTKVVTSTSSRGPMPLSLGQRAVQMTQSSRGTDALYDR